MIWPSVSFYTKKKQNNPSFPRKDVKIGAKREELQRVNSPEEQK